MSFLRRLTQAFESEEEYCENLQIIVLFRAKIDRLAYNIRVSISTGRFNPIPTQINRFTLG